VNPPQASPEFVIVGADEPLSEEAIVALATLLVQLDLDDRKDDSIQQQTSGALNSAM
jgi:hypothetical protein